MGDLGSIPRLGRFPGEGTGSLLQYSGLGNLMDCVVHGVTKSRTRMGDFHSLQYSCLENPRDRNHMSGDLGLEMPHKEMQGDSGSVRSVLNLACGCGCEHEPKFIALSA